MLLQSASGSSTWLHTRPLHHKVHSTIDAAGNRRYKHSELHSNCQPGLACHRIRRHVSQCQSYKRDRQSMEGSNSSSVPTGKHVDWFMVSAACGAVMFGGKLYMSYLEMVMSVPIYSQLLAHLTDFDLSTILFGMAIGASTATGLAAFGRLPGDPEDNRGNLVAAAVGATGGVLVTKPLTIEFIVWFIFPLVMMALPSYGCYTILSSLLHYITGSEGKKEGK